MTTFAVSIYHNLTTVQEAVDNGETDLAPLLPERHAMPVIFARMLGDRRARKGDRLTLILTLDLEASSTLMAAEAAFAAGNSPYQDDAVRTYRAKGVRSLSCGDVVVVHSPDGPATYSCESVGWESADLNDFTIDERSNC